ncbi:MAG: single-stranded DNA-binding protein [Gemmatimonadetes bacterium]|nr:single-stranded DNA-binding protein [Gemmatimonadota bacterium]
MSRSLNKVILIGNIGQDPEVRSTSNGGRVANFSLATSRQWSGQGGDKQEKTEWHRVVAWNNARGAGTGLADVVEKYCKKGDKLYVEGRIEYRSWQDKEGQTRYTTEIIANEIIMLSGKGGSGEGRPELQRPRPRRGQCPRQEGRQGRVLRGRPRRLRWRGRRPSVLIPPPPARGFPGGRRTRVSRITFRCRHLARQGSCSL